MRYALNVTPINGWETHLGQGQADALLSAVGDGYRAFFAEGQAAAMALSAEGAGGLIITGLSEGAALALAASGTGIKALTSTGTAGQSITAIGVPVLQAHPVGTAGMALAVSGAAVKALVGSGLAAQVLSATGTAYRVLAGQAQQADMAMGAEGAGYGAVFGLGEPAGFELAADGYGYRQRRAPAEAAGLAMAGEGAAILYVHVGGGADLDLAAATIGKNLATLGAGRSDMLMDGMAGIPRPIIIPGDYAQTHPSRLLMVEAFEQRIDAGPPSMPIPVSPEKRSFTVPAERSVV